MFLPCLSDEDILKSNLIRRSGPCSKGIYLAVFDNLKKYDEFIRTQLSREKIEGVKGLLSDSEALMKESKKNATCRYMFKDYDKFILDQFLETVEST